MNLKIAARNLLRNRWRSALTAGGVAVAVATLIWTSGMMGGYLDKMVESVTGASLGHIQVHAAQYVDEPSIYHAFELDEPTRARIAGAEGVAAASPRVYSGGLMGNDKRGRLVSVLGVDAVGEDALTSVASRVETGSWLKTPTVPERVPREVVLGRQLAEQLEVAVGDELDIFVMTAAGRQADEVLRVVGTVKTGSADLDRQAVFMHLEDLQVTAFLDGKVHELAIRLERGADLAAGKASVVDLTPGSKGAEPAVKVRTWAEILPGMQQMIELSEGSIWIVYIIIYLLAALGILNTQRMTALERRREFGVLLAIGTRPWRLARTVIAESTLLSLAGGLLGAAIGSVVTWYHHSAGLDMGVFTSDGSGGEFSWMGITFDKTLYFTFTAEMVVTPLVLIAIVGVLCGLWPAIKSARLDVVRAIAGRN